MEGGQIASSEETKNSRDEAMKVNPRGHDVRIRGPISSFDLQTDGKNTKEKEVQKD
jgi:hypothetical protein